VHVNVIKLRIGAPAPTATEAIGHRGRCPYLTKGKRFSQLSDIEVPIHYLPKKSTSIILSIIMTVRTKNNATVILQKLTAAGHNELFTYLEGLSAETKNRFGPHPYDQQSIAGFYHNSGHTGYIARETATMGIAAYAAIKTGILQHDSHRLQSYGIVPDENTDYTFAPSVADAWQSCGIGNALFHFILSDLRLLGAKRMILWGGVQANNDKAVSYYRKNNFQLLGEFDHNGLNYDMALEIA
jgi:diamine N-acetyltransferase